MSTHVLRWMAPALAGLVWLGGCVVPSQDCGGPTSDWPFCRDDAPDLAPTLGDGQADVPVGVSDEPESARQDAGAQQPVPPALGSDDGDATGGLGGLGAFGDAGTCSSCGADAGIDFGAAHDAGSDACGEPLTCDLEAELDAAAEKRISGTPELDFTHGSASWTGHSLDVFFRARDPRGREVRVEVSFDEPQYLLLFGGLGFVDRRAEVSGCDGADPGVLDVRTRVVSVSAQGMEAIFDVSGDGWSSQLLLEGDVCLD